MHYYLKPKHIPWYLSTPVLGVFDALILVGSGALYLALFESMVIGRLK